MKLKIKNGLIYSTPEMIVVGSLNPPYSEEVERAIELGSELIEPVEEFVTAVNTGQLKPRQSVKRFENILIKHGE